jgi:hypothetical protein
MAVPKSPKQEPQYGLDVPLWLLGQSQHKESAMDPRLAAALEKEEEAKAFRNRVDNL